MGMARITEVKKWSPRRMALLSDMPKHKLVRESLSDSVYAILPDLTVIVLMNITLFTGAFASFLRYDAR